MNFSDLNLSAPIQQAIVDQGYTQPTPIQAQAIPAVLDGRDVMAAAQTGTGKTAGFTLPILEKLSKGPRPKANQVRALIVTPTRELANQVWENVCGYSKHLPLSAQVVFGGVKINPQMMKLRRGCDVLVATPGRLLDLHNQRAVKFDNLEVFVLDEADRMLDMGFIHDIKKIINKLPKQRQNLMFSATFSPDIRALAKGMINDPVEVSVAPANSTTTLVEQTIYPVDKSKRTALLKHLIKSQDWQQVLVFARTKHGANRIVNDLEKAKINAAAIHGNKSQNARTKALQGFKDGRINVLVATDIVARGLDIEALPQVVNFDLPNVSEDYVHRIGRTGRAGATGKALSFVTQETTKELFDIERLIQKIIPRHIEPGFEPNQVVPESKLAPPKKAKKPKKPKANAGELDSKPQQATRKKPVQANPQRRRKPSPGKPSNTSDGASSGNHAPSAAPKAARQPRKRPAKQFN
ncbi:DEAD/DEAH box helicase [Salinibius halmophilus]|uniref:DEAD/DEAH box helicase n=1 Tax=Salinibius halmophilus TaxID=1853216 RepID=UPI000E672D42|nr:DEAD/DEAH box helicase [Salinibius halmophilus]